MWRVERTIPGVDASHDELLPYVGPPAALPVFAALAAPGWQPARIVWETLLALATLLLIAGALALAAATDRPRAFAASVLIVASGPLISAFTLGQAALAGAAAATAFIAWERRATAPVCALIAAIQPNLALALAVRLVDRRAFLALGLAALGFAAATLAAGIAPATYLAVLHAHGAAEATIAIQHTVPAVAFAFGAPRSLAVMLGWIATIAALAVVAFALRARPAWRAPAATFALAAAVLPFVAPFFHEHDFVIALVPVVLVLARGDATTRVLGGIAAVAIGIDWFGLAQRPAAAAQTFALGIAIASAAALLAARDDDPPRTAWRVALTPFVAGASLFALALPLALVHRAPTWPDALGDYHASPTASAAGVWAEASRRTGLDAAVPTWGALRAIPLAGCALVAFVCLRLRDVDGATAHDERNRLQRFALAGPGGAVTVGDAERRGMMVADDRAPVGRHLDAVEHVERHGHVHATVPVADERIAAPQHDDLHDREAATHGNDDSRPVGDVTGGAQAGSGSDVQRIDSGSTPREAT